MTRPAATRRAARPRRQHEQSDPRRAWLTQPLDGRPSRVVIDAVTPSVGGGRFAARRIAGDVVVVQADVFAEGHDRLAVALRHRRQGHDEWHETLMRPLGNDRWEGEFQVETLGFHEYEIEGCVDAFASWRAALEQKIRAKQDVTIDLAEGAQLVRETAARATGDRSALRAAARVIGGDGPLSERVGTALDVALAALMTRHRDRGGAARSVPHLVEVERSRARFGAWYELFPRSTSPEPGRHGTLRDCIAWLPYIARMGFDVLYLPPIHPIGTTSRKGRNNATVAAPGDVGSPWAIGGAAGGHDAVHPDLGTIDDFDALVAEARRHGIEIAFDLALQCSPDHPWVREHPGWFRHRPDGTIQHAENPPKKYEDIVPLHFENDRWQALWEELLRVVRHWIGHGVRIFRVDNPHTKPFAFWEWLIFQVRREHPDVVFLSEAFTRPRVLEHLARCGFSQSYTYFTWRNTRPELTEYFTALSRPPLSDFLRPNLFANTPDILHEFLQTGGRAAHQIRLVLAATLAGSYGIYGPPFELCEAVARPGTEEYQEGEKYQIRHWDLDRPGSLAPFITRVNAIRRDNAAFEYPERLRFCDVDNESLIAYARSTPDGANAILVVVNLSPHHAHGGWVTLPLAELGLDEHTAFQMHDLLGDGRYLWQGERNYVALDPAAAPAQIFRVRRRLRTERDFDYYL